jgi:DNA ligase (NAD+)
MFHITGFFLHWESGETVAKTIAREFRTIDELTTANIEQLTAVSEIGPKIAGSIISYFADRENKDIINRLKDFGLRFSGEYTGSAISDKLKGKSIVISGVFIKHSRDEYKNIIEKNGGKNSSSISGTTSFILAGGNMGPAKKEKAGELGVPILSEEDFLKLIGE